MRYLAIILAAIVLIVACLAAIYYLILFLMMALLGLRLWWLYVIGSGWLLVAHGAARFIDKLVK